MERVWGGLLLANAASEGQGVNQKLWNGFVDIAVPYLTMGMADVDA